MGSQSQPLEYRTMPARIARKRLGNARALHRVGQANSFEHPDEIPANIGLIPAKAEARGTSVRVMVFVPVFAPSGQLKGAQPPDVHAGIAFLNFFQVREAVHKTLHV